MRKTKRKTTKPGNMRAFIYSVSKKMRKVRRKGTKKMKVGDKVQLRRRISQKGGKTRLATEKVTILGIYPHHVQVRNQKGIVRSYINWEWQQLTSKEGMEGVESWRRKG